MPKVTVIVPAYNAEKYIEQCAASLLSQTIDDMGPIFINDGSTDKTPLIIEKLIQGHSNAHLFNQENKDLYKTREIGLAKATGEYVDWCDADDFVEPRIVKRHFSRKNFVPVAIKNLDRKFRNSQNRESRKI